MKILMCNSFFYLRGGVERCFFGLSDLLVQHGHQVIPFCMAHPRNRPSECARYFVSQIDFPSLLERKTGLAAKLKVAERVVYFREAKEKFEQLVRDTQPDVVHVQEIDHEISPSILPVAKRFGLPVVQTLHDYKRICPNTNFVSHGEVCERCRRFYYLPVVWRRCKRGSLPASLLACFEMYAEKLSRIYERNVDAFITPSRFLQRKLAQHGFTAPTIHLPNFIDVDRFTPVYEPSDYFLFFGRLVRLKGVETLFEAMRHVDASAKLVVVGEGELEGTLRAYAHRHGISNVTFRGYLDTEALIPLIQHAAFTVFPSECYENYPMALLESLACGTPVIGSNMGGIPEIVEDEHNGLLFSPGNAPQLAERIQFLLNHRSRAVEMGRNGRCQVEAINHPQRHYEQMVGIYRQVMRGQEGR
ncbi:MAG: glycosyltransferase family 4 protein [Anaerolineae bacterium]|nr:glycosyltransferase family 4 protein [Anaerolineae bacterium]